MGDEVNIVRGVNTPTPLTAGESSQTPVSRPSAQVPTSRFKLNARACDSCRRMKVKCDGFDTPPCVRCRKAGRECIFQFPPQIRHPSQNIVLLESRPARPPLRAPEQVDRLDAATANSSKGLLATKTISQAPQVLGHTRHDVYEEPSVVQAAGHAAHGHIRTQLGRSVAAAHNTDIAVEVPSLFFTSPLESVNERNSVNDNAASEHQSEGQTGRRSLWTSSGSTPGSLDFDNRTFSIPKQDLEGMINIFREKLLPNISVLSPADFQDANHLIATDLPLVHCICYVTAYFLSGGQQLREMLLPSITHILSTKLTSPRDDHHEMRTLRALVVLYSYAGCSSPSAQESEKRTPEVLSYWPLKSIVEVYGLRLSLHRSLSHLQTELQASGPAQITESLSYQKYVYWLQLFTMAKYCSNISGTPPSIPIDSSIRAAPLILQEIGMNPQASLFGEVELSVIWETIGSRKQLQEWWCARDLTQTFDESEAEAVIVDVDQRIDNWYQKWAAFMSSDNSRGGVLDYLGRCARFSIQSHITRLLQPSPTGLSAFHLKQIQNCVDRAGRVLDWPLDLSPFQKERLRYISESAGIMVSFCCLFIIASYQTFGSALPDLSTGLDKVEAAARLMLAMAPDTEHPSRVQGSLIISRVQALREEGRHGSDVILPNGYASANMNLSDQTGFNSHEQLIDFYDLGLYPRGISAMDFFGDFSTFNA